MYFQIEKAVLEPLPYCGRGYCPGTLDQMSSVINETSGNSNGTTEETGGGIPPVKVSFYLILSKSIL